MSVSQSPHENRARVLLLANQGASQYAELGRTAEAHLRTRADVTLHDLAASDVKLDDSLAIEDLCEGCSMVFVAGGDGTVSGLLDCLLAWQRPVGIVPLGTANDLARTLQLPADPVQAIDAQLDGVTEKIDVARVNGRAFINVASIGLGVDVTREMDSSEKKAYGAWSYALALWRAWHRSRRVSVRLSLDGQRVSRHIIQLGVANGRYHGGGIAASETASLTDGLFDIYCVRSAPLRDVIWAFVAIGLRRHRSAGSVETYTARKVEVETSRPLEINIDGELAAETPATFEMMPQALPIMRPTAADLHPAAA